MKTIEQKLKNSNIVRVHRSYMVNVNKIDSIGKEKLNILDKTIPIGVTYQEKMKKLMIKKNPLKTFLKIIIPFKSLRKKIRQQIQNKKTVKVEKISSEDKKMLQDFYREDIKKLSELLNRNLNFWVE